MDECRALSDWLPDLLMDTVPDGERESAFRHAEGCAACRDDWDAYRLTWDRMGVVEDREVPPSLRSSFVSEIRRIRKEKEKIVRFPQRFRFAALAQAAAIILAIGAGWLVGNSNSGVSVSPTPATIDHVQSIGNDGRLVMPISRVSQVLDQSPDIRNVRLETGDDGMMVMFDLNSEVVVQGDMQDPQFSKILSHVLQRAESPTYERTRMIDLVRDAYATSPADPEIAVALARVLTSDAHEGVRLKAVDALRTMSAQGAPEVKAALVGVLKNDPNPAIRMKAIDALANLVTAETNLDSSTLETLREKAVQDDENMYVRVKAAEALRQMNL